MTFLSQTVIYASDKVNVQSLSDVIFKYLSQLKVAREEEMKASEEVIYKLQQEEQRLMRSLEYQRLQDEELARKMIKEEQGQVSSIQQLEHSGSLRSFFSVEVQLEANHWNLCVIALSISTELNGTAA